ncbi:MAG: hypothetical protein ACTSVU_00915 [Promethearchaeota archaeon]
MKKVRWRGDDLYLVKKFFTHNGNMSVFLIDDTKYPYLQVNFTSSDIFLETNEIIVNDSNGNSGIKEVLVKEKLLIPTGRWVECQNELCEICQVV